MQIKHYKYFCNPLMVSSKIFRQSKMDLKINQLYFNLEIYKFEQIVKYMLNNKNFKNGFKKSNDNMS